MWGYPVVSDTSAEATEQAWWDQFQDPLLLQFVAAAQSHPSLAEAHARWRQAAALVDASEAALLPSLNLTTSATRSGNSRATNSTASSGSAVLGATWELDLFGRARDALDVAEKSARTSSEQVRQTRIAMAASTASAYLSVLQCENLATLAASDRVTREQEVLLSKAKVSSGLSTGSELANTQLLAQQAQTAERAQRVACQQGRLALMSLTGLPIAWLDTVLPRGEHALPRLRSLSLSDAPATVLERRPDIQVALAQASAAYSTAKYTSKNQLPRLTLTGTLGLSAISSSAPTADLTPWSLASTISWALFSSGKLEAERAQANAAYDEKSAALRTAIRNAANEVEAATIQVQESNAALADAERSLAQTNIATQATHARFVAGLTDGANENIAKRADNAARRNVLAAQATNALANVSLYKALGGALPDSLQKN
jgi:outer membrane protein, multidrug efflux system